jgi:hypothetical protein
MDTGLIGTCGLLGCCGGRRRSRSRSRPPRPSSTSRTLQDSFPLPSKAALARFSPPPSMSTSVGPPSVLRPEQAFRPYKEDSDDEGGYIMRAWQPFPQPVYTPVDEAPLPEPKSGFTRVGGGRAHFDPIRYSGTRLSICSTAVVGSAASLLGHKRGTYRLHDKCCAISSHRAVFWRPTPCQKAVSNGHHRGCVAASTQLCALRGAILRRLGHVRRRERFGRNIFT